MTDIILAPNIDRPDDLYEMLVTLTAGSNSSQSLKAQARLIFIMANHIGDTALIGKMVEIASNEE